MKGLDIALAGILAVCAVIQYNDPDPVYWVTVYGIAACVPALSIAGKRSELVAGIAIGMIASGMLYAVPGFFDYLASGRWGTITGAMDGADAYVEPAREFLGLGIALAIVAFYVVRRGANQNR